MLENWIIFVCRSKCCLFSIATPFYTNTSLVVIFFYIISKIVSVGRPFFFLDNNYILQFNITVIYHLLPISKARASNILKMLLGITFSFFME